jgi:hypothetical protein
MLIKERSTLGLTLTIPLLLRLSRLKEPFRLNKNRFKSFDKMAYISINKKRGVNR